MVEKLYLTISKFLKTNLNILYSNKFDKQGENFNFFNPACFLFPDENNCLPGDTFKIDEKEKLTKFTSYNQFEFKQSPIQKISNYISIFSFIGCLIYLFVSFIIYLFKIRKKT